MINENRIVPYTTVDLPVNEGPWLVIAPHADDETFGMGGTILKAVEQGIRVQIVIMTDGALGGSKQDLVKVRQQEACTAASLLGCEKPVFLDNPDRGLVLNEETVDQVSGLLARFEPKAVFFPGINELHPDHRAASLIIWKTLQIGQESFAANVVPVSYEVLVQSPVNSLVDITSYIDRKKQVMAVYPSQLEGNRYVGISTAINKLRTLTLPAESEYAEGFYCYHRDDIARPLHEIFGEQIRAALMP